MVLGLATNDWIEIFGSKTRKYERTRVPISRGSAADQTRDQSEARLSAECR